jgi:hypothetical protein
MKVTNLTTDQQTKVAALKDTLTTAQAAAVAPNAAVADAQQAFQAYLTSVVGVSTPMVPGSPMGMLMGSPQLTADGTSVVSQ